MSSNDPAQMTEAELDVAMAVVDSVNGSTTSTTRTCAPVAILAALRRIELQPDLAAVHQLRRALTPAPRRTGQVRPTSLVSGASILKKPTDSLSPLTMTW